MTVSFTTVNPIPANGKIVVTFHSGFGLSSGSATTVSSENFDGGTNALSINGQVITITRDNLGTEIGASSAVSVVLTNIKNPSDLGSTGTYSIKTATSGDATIEEDTAVAADTIAVETNITETTTLTATSTSQNETGIARSSTAALGNSFALGFPRTSPFALGDSSQSGANLGRAPQSPPAKMPTWAFPGHRRRRWAIPSSLPLVKPPPRIRLWAIHRGSWLVRSRLRFPLWATQRGAPPPSVGPRTQPWALPLTWAFPVPRTPLWATLQRAWWPLSRHQIPPWVTRP